ncbi:gluconate 2-dehydrogenase subunit 3 family protein [Consotaella aegiceratis]|uniref:gluconate 2-dehydrogenase subunit 3 family protein n=1 Tax=Consotaella aegiceratis TaxID=3097961 RepID=UPI002F4179FD
MSTHPFRPNRRSFLRAGAAGVALLPFQNPALAQAKKPPVPLTKYTAKYFNADEWVFIQAATARLIPSEGDGPGAIEARVPVFIDNQLAGDFGQAADWYMEGPHKADADPLMGFQSPLTPAEIYRQGIAVFDKWCADTMGKRFADLDADGQDAALKALEGKGDQQKPTHAAGGDFAQFNPSTQGAGQAAPEATKVPLPPELRNFFSLLLQNTKEGYFADPMYGGNHEMAAWVYIGFPGARANFREWVDQDNVPYPLGPVSISGERA